MYNEELKQAFLDDHCTSVSGRNNCARVFDCLEEFEANWGADLCTRSAEELRAIVDVILGMRVTSSNAFRIKLLRDYAQWCIDKGVPGACDGMFGVNFDRTNKMKSQTVANPLQLQTYLNILFDPESDKTIDNVYRCFFWLAYSGMKEENIFKVKSADVDLFNMIVRYEGVGYPIYRESIQAFKNCVELSAFACKHPSCKQTAFKPRVSSPLLIRGTQGVSSVSTMRNLISKKSRECIAEGKTDRRMSYYRTWISGVFYRMYELECTGYPPDFSALADEVTRGKTYNLSKTKVTMDYYRKEVANDYLNDYELWKRTFI